ncbi:alpha/beta hydrolase [Patulibacter americanus]|uniref:alpha/beta hydrolase n=1 Tax=Patulibacter americanus TaxID=588672 RepID=UPI0003B42685|nr:phospholipase [Patulibacter americanus]
MSTPEIPELAFRERPADGTADGLLVLHHGRGADENDLIGLADVLDPERRLHVVTPGGPLRVPGWPGQHWYVVPQVGYPDPDTFRTSYLALGAFHDALWERTGIAPSRTILGGFSMGSVMSHATGLGPGRPVVAGVLGLSGFVPTVEGWQPDLAPRTATRVLNAHGRRDPVIAYEFAERARALVRDGGLDLTALDFDGGHQIAPEHVPAIASWIAETLPPRG